MSLDASPTKKDYPPPTSGRSGQVATTAAMPVVKPEGDAGAQTVLLARLRTIVGHAHVLTGASATRRFVTGYRFGAGEASVVVRPGTLVQLWRVLKACVAAGRIIVMQSANTGLTGGSTPHGKYDRDVAIINTMRIGGILPLDDGREVVCLPGATLDRLERVLEPLGREPHSVIGSSCIGASVFGGVCNNSGGSLIQRGPAYTEMALFARVDRAGSLVLVNHLGIDLGADPEEILGRLDRGDLGAADIAADRSRKGSDRDYADHVRLVDEPTPARFNADPRRLFEASGSAGKLALFAVRLDTFARTDATATFYIGTNATADLSAIRRHVLTTFKRLPISGEYIHRDAFDLAARYGKDLVIAIERLGTARLPALFAFKDRLDALARRLKLLPDHFSDRLLQIAGSFARDHLPRRMRAFRDRFEHHLILKVDKRDVESVRTCLSQHMRDGGAFYECTPGEARKAFLHRFAVAGAAVRYRAMHAREVAGIISLDIAVRRNDTEWFEQLPPDIERLLVGKIYYGHFFCHVFHQDYIVRAGADLLSLEHTMLQRLDQRGAECPAEHNVGHLYAAKTTLADFYRTLDPKNVFNPGIGQTSRELDWA